MTGHHLFSNFSDSGAGVRVHLAPVGGGRAVSCSEGPRASFANHSRLLAYDCELDAVLDSVIGNRKDCFIAIRGKGHFLFILYFHGNIPIPGYPILAHGFSEAMPNEWPGLFGWKSL